MDRLVVVVADVLALKHFAVAMVRRISVLGQLLEKYLVLIASDSPNSSHS
jgi:hypothetical protein